MDKEAQTIAMNKAKIGLMAKPDSSFFTTLCFSLKHRFDDNVPTAYTNGTEVVWGTKFFMEMLDQEERIFLMLHETLHCAYLHMTRIPVGADKQRWNIACDHVINLQLIERGFKMPVKVPGHADRQFTGMGAEEVYKLLPDDPGKPAMDDLVPGDGPPEELQKTMEDILVRASVQSRIDNDRAGTIPGDIQIFLDNLLKPKLPWNRILQKYLHALSKNDYSYRRPNRRFMPTYYLPSLYSEKLMDIAVAVDTSGSVSDEEFKRFVSEVASILRMMKPEKLTLVQFDTQIHSVTKMHSVNDLIKTTFVGRGGTDIKPVIEWAKANKPQLLLVFTDGYFRFPGPEITCPVIWLIHDNKQFQAPFGKVIEYTV